MNLDELARSATQSLRDSVDREVDPQRMLASVRRTRTRRRTALVAVPLLAVAVAAAAVWTGVRLNRPEPVHPPAPVLHTNGVLIGGDNPRLAPPSRWHVPPLGFSSSPAWSPDGREIAVLAGGILVTDVQTGAQRSLPCPGCRAIAWSPDGSRLAGIPSLGSTIVLVDATTGRTSHVQLHGLDTLSSPSWSPDGRSLAFVADAPHDHHGAYVADLATARVTEVMSGVDVPVNARTRPAGALALSWSSRDRIAVLEAALPARFESGFRLSVFTTTPEGTGTTLLAADGTCACAGFAPVLTWSPDGSTLAVHAQHPGRSIVDVDGTPVRIRFVTGSDYLVWQPRSPR